MSTVTLIYYSHTNTHIYTHIYIQRQENTHILYACTYTKVAYKGEKTGIEPSSTAQCTVWLCIMLYTVYPRNPRILVCVCACVFVCACRGQRSVSEGLGNAHGTKFLLNKALSVYSTTRRLWDTLKGENIGLRQDDCMSRCMFLSPVLFAALFL